MRTQEQYAVSNNNAIHTLADAVTDCNITVSEHTYSIERIERTRMELIK